MSHEHRNRGKESNDDKLFGPKQQLRLREALLDYNFLLTRGYAQRSSVQLVGNRYRLNARQQKALMNMGASEVQVALRTARSVIPAKLAGASVAIDGFNLIIVLESLLSGGYVFKGADGFFRDIAGIHGSYKRVAQTSQALTKIGSYLQASKVQRVHWLLDKPVSNSGRLKSLLLQLAAENQWLWKAELVFNPDRELAKRNDIVISSDAWVLDHAPHNFNLLAVFVAQLHQPQNVVSLL